MAFRSKPSQKVTSQETATRRMTNELSLWESMIWLTSIPEAGMAPAVASAAGPDATTAGTRPIDSGAGTSVDAVIHGRSPHIARVAGVIEGRGAMHGAAIVPDNEIPCLMPAYRGRELRLGGEFGQFLQQFAPPLHGPADDVRGMSGEVQRFDPSAGVKLHQPMLRGLLGFPLLRRRFRIAGQHPRMPQPMF